jgi:hypothetical protein
MYILIVSWLTVPAVLRKQLRVHNEGSLLSCGKASRR